MGQEEIRATSENQDAANDAAHTNADDGSLEVGYGV